MGSKTKHQNQKRKKTLNKIDINSRNRCTFFARNHPVIGYGHTGFLVLSDTGANGTGMFVPDGKGHSHIVDVEDVWMDAQGYQDGTDAETCIATRKAARAALVAERLKAKQAIEKKKRKETEAEEARQREIFFNSSIFNDC